MLLGDAGLQKRPGEQAGGHTGYERDEPASRRRDRRECEAPAGVGETHDREKDDGETGAEHGRDHKMYEASTVHVDCVSLGWNERLGKCKACATHPSG